MAVYCTLASLCFASSLCQPLPSCSLLQGIGLTRTEHMFFATHQRIAAVRRMIAAVELGSPAAAEALKELQGYQTQVRGAALRPGAKSAHP